MELWSDRAYQLTTIDARGMNNPHIMGGFWVWRVDRDFIANAVRLIAKSKATGIPIDAPELERMRELWAVSEELYPGLWATLPNDQFPGRLPGLEMIAELHDYQRFGLIPKTADWKPRAEDGPNVETLPRPASKPKRENTPEMF